MLSFRQISGALWTVLGFMITAAVVLNLRYRSMDDGALLLDTWTGQVRSVAAAPLIEKTEAEAGAEQGALDIAVLKGFEWRLGTGVGTCEAVRFAVPAPERIVVRTREVRPQSDYR